jgi:hypothetical protein
MCKVQIQDFRLSVADCARSFLTLRGTFHIALGALSHSTQALSELDQALRLGAVTAVRELSGISEVTSLSLRAASQGGGRQDQLHVSDAGTPGRIHAGKELVRVWRSQRGTPARDQPFAACGQ